MSKTNEYISVKNFDKYQHYSHRRPPWIKLYWSLLSDPEYVELSSVSKWQLVAIMLLASQHDNKIPFKKSWIQRAILSESRINWDELFNSGFIIRYHDASVMLATTSSKKVTETETETETEKSRDREQTVPSELSLFKSFLSDKYEEIRGYKLITEKSDWISVSNLIKSINGNISYADLRSAWIDFLNSGDPFHQKQGHPLRWWCSNINAFLGKKNETRNVKKTIFDKMRQESNLDEKEESECN